MSEQDAPVGVEEEPAADAEAKVCCRDCQHFVVGEEAIALIAPKMKKFGRKHALARLRRWTSKGYGTCTGDGLNTEGKSVDVGHGNLTAPEHSCVKGQPR